MMLRPFFLEDAPCLGLREALNLKYSGFAAFFSLLLRWRRGPRKPLLSAMMPGHWGL